MALKDSAEEWVRKAPTQAAALVAAIALVVGAVVGLGAGYKIEQNRTRSDVKRLEAEAKAGGGTVNATGAIGQRLGKVTAASTGSITLSTKGSGVVAVKTTSATLTEQAVKASLTAVTPGSRILVTVGGREIIVLATASKLGRVVTAVAADSISLQKPNSSASVKLEKTDVRAVETVKTAPTSAIKTGVNVIVGGSLATKTSFDAIEVIVLPAGSSFAN